MSAPGVVLKDTEGEYFVDANGDRDSRYMDDDSGTGLNARLDNIRPSADGTYFITVRNTKAVNASSVGIRDEGPTGCT